MLSPSDPAHAPMPSRPRRRPAQWLWLLAAVPLAALLALVAGFALFVAGIEGRDAQAGRRADGIVVLTGGSERIAEATNLLLEGRGKRLLITGVHPDTTLDEIMRTVPATREALECCVELGRAALNTQGNAIEAGEWAKAHDFRSLLVVTSAWHMPRALVELRRTTPGITLVPYPVVPRRAAEGGPPTLAGLRLLAVEYVKFLAASLGVRAWPAVTSQMRETGRLPPP
ncbi:YdcF family protein [Ancylobacter sp. IITR112]|uniref:YdcF family protein n=1 Tax=Ancylobacter sp. IITR112 TaxID=3138073 RepID=UPI00352B49F3